MNLNYAIFRSQPIMTINDLAGIGSHNKREKQSYKSNPDIKKELSSNNIELVPLTEKYVRGFYNKTIDYKKEFEERMKTEREDRKRTFREMLDKSKNVVADELLFTATNTFFKDMTREDIKVWADTCMDFVYNDLGYTKDQILHATVHLDEKTPHIHCVVIPIVKKLDKRSNSERYTISKKQYIKDKNHLSELQDKYHKRLISKGYDLERGIKNSDNENINLKEFKKITRKLNNELNVKNERLNKSLEVFNEKMKTSKEVLLNKEYVKIKKDTFDSMNNVIKESKKVMDMQPKLNYIYKEIDNYSYSYRSIERQKNNLENEIEYLQYKNEKLENENRTLKNKIKAILKAIKTFFRQILLFGNDKAKEATTNEIMAHYDNKNFTRKDVVNISLDTTKEGELFNYVGVEKEYVRMKHSELDYDSKEKDEKEFELSL